MYFIRLLFLISLWINAADNTEQIMQAFPYAALEAKEISLGILAVGSDGSGQIRLTNKGEPELRIARVRSSCGLMIPTWPGKPIARGDTASIRFRYDTRRQGIFERKIIIHTNAWQKTIVVTVSGEVVPENVLQERAQRHLY